MGAGCGYAILLLQKGHAPGSMEYASTALCSERTCFWCIRGARPGAHNWICWLTGHASLDGEVHRYS